MASLFGPEDSDNEYDEVDQQEVQSDNESLSGFEKWRKRDDGEAVDDGDSESEPDEVVFTVKSKREKALDQIQNECDDVDFAVGCTPPWKKTLDAFAKFRKTVDTFFAKERYLPSNAIDTINLLAEELTKAQSLNREEVEKNEWRALTEVRKTLGETTALYKNQIDSHSNNREDNQGTASGQAAAASGEPSNEEYDENYMTTLMAELENRVTKKSAKCNAYTAVMKKALERNFVNIAFHCGAKAVENAALDRDDPNFPPLASQRTAFDKLTGILALMKEHRLTVTERKVDFDKDKKLTFIDGGWGTLAAKLYANVVEFCQWHDITEPKYMDWVRMENQLVGMFDHILSLQNTTVNCRVILLPNMLEMLSTRSPKIHVAFMNALPADASWRYLKNDLTETITAIYDAIFDSTADATIRNHATMHLAYHHAVCNRFQKARDILLQSKAVEIAQHGDDSSHILANRVVAQVGLSAFRIGLFNEAHTLLNDLCSRKSHKVSELLGQSIVSRRREENVDRNKGEVFDRKRLVPPHRDIPVDVLSTAFLVVSMLLDTVSQAAKPFDPWAVRNAEFADICKFQTIGAVVGPPVETNELIYSAYDHIIRGDVKSASRIIRELPVWNHLHEKEATLELLCKRVKMDGLRVFLITRGNRYASLTLSHLASQFELSEESVFATVARLLQDSTVIGFWDAADTVLTIERGTMSKFHHLAKSVSDRVSELASYNAALAGEGSRGDSHKNRAVWNAAGAAGRGGRGGRGGARGRGGRGGRGNGY